MPSKEKVGCKQKTGRNVAERSMEHLHTLTATTHLCAILAVSPICTCCGDVFTCFLCMYVCLHVVCTVFA